MAMAVFTVIGVVLILLGLLFCLTIVGAFVGIPLIIVGAILCAIGSKRRTVITNVVQVSTVPGAGPANSLIFDSSSPNLNREPSFASPIKDVSPRRIMLESETAEPTNDGGARRDSFSKYSYDRAKWEMLVRYDSDISRIVEVLKSYDQKYTDELAAAYLALNDKTYLPMIVDKILANARQHGEAMKD
jgi:hypothetical protein